MQIKETKYTSQEFVKRIVELVKEGAEIDLGWTRMVTAGNYRITYTKPDVVAPVKPEEQQTEPTTEPTAEVEEVAAIKEESKAQPKKPAGRPKAK